MTPHDELIQHDHGLHRPGTPSAGVAASRHSTMAEVFQGGPLTAMCLIVKCRFGKRR